MLMQDTMEDFYPPNVGNFNTYNPPESDATPQATTIPANVLARGSSQAWSTVAWAFAFVAAAIVLMHLVGE